MESMDFLPIRVSTLRGDFKITFDAFVRVAGKYILYCRRGDSFEGGRLDRLKEKKLKKLYIPQDHEPLYRSYISQSIDAAYDKAADKPMEVRAQIITGAQQAAAEELMENPENEAFYKAAQQGSQKYINFILKEQQALRSVINIANTDKSVSHHCVNVATLALAMAGKLGFQEKNPLALNTLMLGALLHDIEHNYSALTIARPVKEMSAQELAVYKAHPYEGANRIKSFKHFDPMIIKIIYEHEETIEGSGYPRGLQEKEIDPIVQIVSTANVYERYISFEGKSHKEALKNMLIEKMGLQTLENFKILQEVLKEYSVIG